ncbi:MAG: type II toxin-antitoxin system PemK/MazF family toxin [Deltaproteobacteria bacterium]|nr:type II toxin-antitoxin system PemK/MazF family toxin [Deltaproteobacteria bacterium]
MDNPLRGEIWLIDLNPNRGHEQAGKRPGLVFSIDLFNQGPAGLIVVIPVTAREKGIPWHVEIKSPEGGLNKRSFVRCEDIRSVAKEQLVQKLGRVTQNTMAVVEDRLRILLDL